MFNVLQHYRVDSIICTKICMRLPVQWIWKQRNFYPILTLILWAVILPTINLWLENKSFNDPFLSHYLGQWAASPLDVTDVSITAAPVYSPIIRKAAAILVNQQIRQRWPQKLETKIEWTWSLIKASKARRRRQGRSDTTITSSGSRKYFWNTQIWF